MIKNILLILICLFALSNSYAQYPIVENFSSTDPAGWSSTCWDLSTNYGSSLSGSYSASISSGNNNCYFYMPFDVICGNIYDISFYTKRICNAQVYINDTPDQTTPLYSFSGNLGCNNSWPQTNIPSYTATSDGTLYFMFANTNNLYGNPTTGYLDNFRIEETVGVPCCQANPGTLSK